MKSYKQILLVTFAFTALNFCLALGIPSAAHAIELKKDVNLANFVFTNPLKASVSTAFLASAEQLTLQSFRTRNDRSNLPGVENRDAVDVGFAFLPDSSDLMIVLTGLGGSPSDSLATFVSLQVREQLHTNVMTLPNPLSWKSAIALSQSGYPGFAKTDAQELIPLIQRALTFAERQKGSRFDKISILGYSLGALQAAFLAPVFEKQTGRSLYRIVLVNSPVFTEASIDAIDQLTLSGSNFTGPHRDHIWGAMMNLISNKILQIDDVAAQSFLNKNISLNDFELKWLIGDSFRQTLGDVIVLSQKIQDRHLLRSSADAPSARLAEARQFSFRDYMTKAVAPNLIRTGVVHSVQDMIAQGSLTQLQATLQQDRRYFFFHTSNDFLTSAQTKAWANRVFAERAIYFNGGGHMGEVETSEFWRELQRVAR